MNDKIINQHIQAVTDAFRICGENLHPEAIKLLNKSDYFLTRLLLIVAAHGSQFPEEKLKKTALALEFLDQAAKLSYLLQAGECFQEMPLLITDYFYAQAISQVIDLDEPMIIKILAQAIADTAAAKMTFDSQVSYRQHLIAAAVELGFKLGVCQNSNMTADQYLFQSITELGLDRKEASIISDSLIKLALQVMR